MPLPLNVQLDVPYVPPPLVDQVTTPVGAVRVPVSVTETVAVQVVASAALTGFGAHAGVTWTPRGVIVRLATLVLVLGLKFAPPL